MKVLGPTSGSQPGDPEREWESPGDLFVYSRYKSAIGLNLAAAYFCKFYWDTTTFICLCVGYDCFCTTRAELSICIWDHRACKAESIYYLAFCNKGLSVNTYFTLNLTLPIFLSSRTYNCYLHIQLLKDCISQYPLHQVFHVTVFWPVRHV